jgi:hypothetical protein
MTLIQENKPSDSSSVKIQNTGILNWLPMARWLESFGILLLFGSIRKRVLSRTQATFKVF